MQEMDPLVLHGWEERRTEEAAVALQAAWRSRQVRALTSSSAEVATYWG